MDQVGWGGVASGGRRGAGDEEGGWMGGDRCGKWSSGKQRCWDESHVKDLVYMVQSTCVPGRHDAFTLTRPTGVCVHSASFYRTHSLFLLI